MELENIFEKPSFSESQRSKASLEISKGLVYAAMAYLVVLLYGLNFIFSNISLGGLTYDFWLIALIILLPLILSVLYIIRTRIGLDHETLMRRLIIAFIIIAALFVLFFIVPFSY